MHTCLRYTLSCFVTNYVLSQFTRFSWADLLWLKSRSCKKMFFCRSGDTSLPVQRQLSARDHPGVTVILAKHLTEPRPGHENLPALPGAGKVGTMIYFGVKNHCVLVSIISLKSFSWSDSYHFRHSEVAQENGLALMGISW